jgi:hypothetical protein
MKRNISLLLVLFLTACAPAQIASPTPIPATATVIAVTATPAPTSTPAPPSTAPADLLTQNGLGDQPVYWQDANGGWFAGSTNGDLKLFLAPDGNWLATPDGFAEFVNSGGHWDPEQNAWVDKDGKSQYAVDENGKLVAVVVKYDEQVWKKMTPEQKVEAYVNVPIASPEQYVKSNVSTLEGMDNKIIYRDENGVAMSIYNFLTGKFESMKEAGIKEIPLTTGENWEVRYFSNGQDMVNHAVLVDGAKWGNKVGSLGGFRSGFYDKYVYNVPGWGEEFKTGMSVSSEPGVGHQVFEVMILSYDGGALVTYLGGDGNDESDMRAVFVDMKPQWLAEDLMTGVILTPKLTH